METIWVVTEPHGSTAEGAVKENEEGFVLIDAEWFEEIVKGSGRDLVDANEFENYEGFGEDE